MLHASLPCRAVTERRVQVMKFNDTLDDFDLLQA
jgi:hypothetical protein